MKKIFAAVFITLQVFTGQAHMNIGSDITTANPSARLASSKKETLIQAMTTKQRHAIAKPVKGAMVYDVTAKSLYSFNGYAWVNLSSAGPAATHCLMQLQCRLVMNN